MELNKLKIISSIILLIGIITASNAQTKYWVKFKNKNGSPYSISNPSSFLSAQSIQRRANQNIAIDYTDLPVNQSYINLVNATGAQVFQRSKWLNAVIVIVSNPAQLTAINSLTCVLNSSVIGKFIKTTGNEPTYINPTISSSKKTTTSTSYNYGPAITQVSQIGADCLHSLGFRGQNMTIAVIDDGFSQVDINPVFDSLRNESRLLGTRDFVAGNQSVFEDDSHGAVVLSTIVGNSPGNLIGTGPKAKVWLLRSEDIFSEKLIEEANWVVAAEFADSVGADIATTSLGYTTFDNAADNHVYADLNGKTSVASIASTMAVRKGMFVLNAAGNEGAGSWMFIGVPADADSICTVGAVNGSGVHSNFSSVGPTADGRIKPDVSTMGEGTFICQPGYNFVAANGTSFACPIMAGAVACLWQANPTRTNMQILQAIKATASQSTTPNNTYGWGIPNMCAAHNYLLLMSTVNNLPMDNSIKLYPNPVKNILNITSQNEVLEIKITDVLGKEIAISNEQLNNNYSIRFSEAQSAGVYFILLKTTTGIYSKKFIKE